MMEEGKYRGVLSIAGFDPSAGAGVLADCKTFEQAGVYGCGIASSITSQNDIAFHSIRWLEFEEIESQFNSLTARFEFNYVKIGLIESIDTLQKCIDMLTNYKPEIRIVWDPVLKASAGFIFHADINREKLEKALKGIYLITPNTLEAKKLEGILDEKDAGNALARYCKVFLKGGHEKTEDATDVLFTDADEIRFSNARLEGYSKHGSGCVLSAAITAYLEKGYSLTEACKIAKEYTLAFLKSSPNELGLHHVIKCPY